MESELKKLGSKDLLEAYNKNKEFLEFLKKEYKNAERMRDENE